MIKYHLLFGLIALHSPLSLAASLDTEEKRISYMVGQQIGQQLTDAMVPVDEEALFLGMHDFLSHKPSKMSEKEIEQALRKYRAYKWEQEFDQLAKENLEQSKSFFAKNASAPGIKTTESGLQYRILRSAPKGGAKPRFTDIVAAHYTAETLGGRQLDNSYSRSLPVNIQINSTLAGLREALLMMSVGDKWQLYIPAHLGYGKDGAGQEVGPNEGLIYELELIANEMFVFPEKSK